VREEKKVPSCVDDCGSKTILLEILVFGAMPQASVENASQEATRISLKIAVDDEITVDSGRMIIII